MMLAKLLGVQDGGPENKWYLPQRRTRNLGREVGPQSPCNQASCSVLCETLSFSLHKKGLAGKVHTQKVRLAGAMAVAAKVTKLASCAPQWVTAVAQELTIVVKLAHDRRSYFCVSFSPRSLANAGSQS